MTLKRNIRHPNFIIGLLSYLLFLMGVVFLIYNSDVGQQLTLLSIIMGGAHWIGSIIDVRTDSELKATSGADFCG